MSMYCMQRYVFFSLIFVEQGKNKKSMESIRLSVIMPMYNVEKYIENAIVSVLDGGLAPEDYELIVINDGSTDGGGEVVTKMEQVNDALKRLNEAGHWHYVKRENHGLSASRNVGYGHSQGRYLFFMDSDDFIKKDVLKLLLEKAEKNDLDVLRFNLETVDETGAPIKVSKNPKQYVDYGEDVMEGMRFLEKKLGYGCYACQFLLKREMMDGCLFTPNIYFEDTEWTPRMLQKAKRVASTSVVAYYYTQRKGSITQATDEKKLKKLLEDKLSLLKTLKKRKEETGLKWFDTMACRTALSIFNDPTLSSARKVEIVKEMKSMSIWPLTLRQIPFPKSMRVVLLDLFPNLYIRFLGK